MDNKKYVIVWNTNIAKTLYFSWAKDVEETQNHLFHWCHNIENGTVFTLAEAEKIHRNLVERYGRGLTEGMKIYEYIPPVPAKVGNEVKSENPEKDEILDELLKWQEHSKDYCLDNHYRFFKRLFTFIEKNTK